jgi:hypothetical protein
MIIQEQKLKKKAEAAVRAELLPGSEQEDEA